MKSITKRIISTLVICGALVLEAGATAFSSIGKGIARQTKAADSTVVASFSRSGTSDTYTSGLTFKAQAEGKTGYYQDGSGTERYIQLTGSNPFWANKPKSISLSAVIGGGTAKESLGNSVYAVLLNSSGEEISGTSTLVTDKVEVTTGKEYTVTIPSTSSAYGIRIKHTKESGYNVRYYSFSLSYIAGSEDDPKLTSIVVSGNMSKTKYTTDDKNWDFSGLSATGYFDKGDPADITNSVTWKANPVAPTLGTSKISIVASRDSIDSEAYSQNVTVAVSPVVTFVAGTDTSTSSTLTKDGVTISMSTLNRDDNYRANSGTNLSVSVEEGNINKVEFTCTGSGTADYGPGKMNLANQQPGVYSYSNNVGTWEGSAGSITLKTTAQVRMTQIKVTLEPNKVLTGIVVKTEPVTEYFEGEVFDPTGLVLTATYDKGEPEDIPYENHESDFEFNPDLITPLTTEDTAVTITYGGKTVDQAITVNENLDPYISSVEITKSATSVLTHENITASAKVTVENDPSSTLSKNVNWVQSSEDGGEVTFSKSTSASEEQITISGKTAGTVTIQAKSAETPTVLDSFTLTIGKNIVVTDVSINGGDINKTSGYINDTQDLTATVSYEYEEGTNAVTWESSQPDVVSVEASTGKIKFLANTTSAVTITATSVENTEKSDTIRVTASNLVKKPSLGGLEDGEKYFIILTWGLKDESTTDPIEYYLTKFSKTNTTAVVNLSVWPGDSSEQPSVDDAWTFTASDKGDDWWTIKSSEDKYLYATANNNGLNCGATSDTWHVIEGNCSGDETTYYTANHLHMLDETQSRYLTAYKDTPNGRAYTSTVGQDGTNGVNGHNSTVRFVKYVEPVKPASLTLDTDEYTFTSISGNKVVTPTVLGPDSAAVTDDYEIEWESTNEECATVEENTDGNGVITPVGTGTTTITATIDGQYTESGNDLVESVEITVRTFGFDEDNIPSLIAIDETLDLNDYLLVDPDFDGSETYVWTSSDDTKLSVEDGVITGIAETEEPVTITVKVSDEGNIAGNVYEYTDSVSFDVVSGVVTPIRVELDSNESNLILGGESDKITAVVYGEDDVPATAQDIVITGSYSSVVEVSEDDNEITITPIAVGETTIFVNFVGGTEDTAEEIAVKVDYAELTSLELEADKEQIFGDGEVEITATPNEYASLADVEFTVSPAIATVTHKEGNVYTLTPNDKYVGGTVTITASDGNVDSNELTIDIVDYLNYIGKPSIIPAYNETLKLENLGANLGTTASDDIKTVSIKATGTEDSYDLSYKQCKKQGSAILLTKSVGAFIANSTAMPGVIKSVTVHINSGAAGATTYYCNFFTTAQTKATDSGTPVNITGGNSHNFTCDVENAKYFCIALGNANNGQVLSVDVEYEVPQSEGPEVNISNTNITVQKQVVEYAHWLNENYSDGIEVSDWATISAKYSEVLGSLEGDDLDLAKYMFKNAEALTGTDSDCLQNCVSLYDAAAKKYNLIDSSNNFMGRTLEADTYAYSYDAGDGQATGGSDAGNYVYGSEITLPSVSYDGYKFDGWYTDSGFTTPLVNTDGKFNMPAGAVTAYAKWVELDTYNVELTEDSEFIKGLIDADGNPVESIKEGQDLEVIVDILDSATTLPEEITVEIDGVVLSPDNYFYGDILDVTMIKIGAEYITGDVSITIVATHGDIEVDAELNGLTVDTTFPQTVEYGTIISGTLTPEDDNRKLPSSISVNGVDASLVSYNSETGEFSFPANATYEITIYAYADYINAPINQDGLNDNDLYVDEESIPVGVDAEIEIKTNNDILDLSTIELIVTGVEEYSYNSETHIITIEGQYVVGPIEISGYALPKTVNVDHSSIDTNAISYTDMTEGEMPIPAYLTGDFTATILPQEGYENVELTITMNGVTLEAGEDYTYNALTGELFIENITGDIVINATASLIPEVYTITIQEDAYITVTADKETVTAGDSVTFTVELSSHYHVDSITYTIGGGEPKTATLDENNQFTIENVSGNIVVTAKSKIDSYSVTYNSDANSSATGAETVAHGGDLEVTVTAITAHYHIDTVTYTVNGGEPKTATLDKDGKFTITDIDGAVVINVTSALDTHTVTASGDENVDVTFNTTSPVTYGTDVTFTVTADDGYNIATVQYKIGNGEWEDAELNINSQFTLHVTGDVQVKARSAIKTFDIILPEFDNFVITAVPNPVEYGGSTNVAISVDEHYHVTLLGYTIDGQFIDITDQVVLVNNCYQFQIYGITGDVEVTFTVAIDTVVVTTNFNESTAQYDITSVEYDGTYTNTFIANTGYYVTGVTYQIGDADPVTVTGNTVTINNVTAALTITVNTEAAEAVVTGITVQPTEITVEFGEDVNLNSLVVTATYSDGTSKTVTGFTVTDYNKDVAGEYEATVEYTEGDVTVTCPLKVIVNAEVVLESISVDPTSVTIAYGGSIDVNSLTVTAHYSDGGEVTVTDFVLGNYNAKQVGEQDVTITYQGETCTLKLVVEDKVIDHIEVVEGSYTTSVYQGDEYTFDGKVNVYYVNDEEPVEISEGFTVSEIDTSILGEKTLTVSYGGKSVEVKVNVVAKPVQPTVTELVVTDYTNKIEVGGTYTFDGIVVAKYSDGTQETLEASQYTVSALDTSTEGEKTVTITFGEKTKDITVTVYKPEQPKPQDPPMSTGAKVGIGVGAAAGSIGLAVGLFFLIKLFKLKK